MTTVISKSYQRFNSKPSPSLIESLTPHLLTHYQWSLEELNDYVEQNHLQLFTCAQQAVMAFLNLTDQPLEAAQIAYQRLSQLSLNDLSTSQEVHSWMNQIFEQVTTDYGEILEVEGQSYYVIFKESN